MISVIMPAYNASKFISPAIESILKQTLQELELIIIDDGSTDNTLEIVKRYAEQDSRIRVIQTNHRGPSNARNAGITAAKYSWIGILDADDIALPERFEKQINMAKANPKVVAWGSAIHHINSQGKILSYSPHGPQTEEAFYRLRQEGHVVGLYHPTALLNKEVVLNAGGYDPQFQAAQDIELLDSMAEYGPILATPEPLVLYRVHSQSLSMQHFFLQKISMRYVRARHQARLAGKKEPTFEEYIEKSKQRPAWTRLFSYLKTLGIFHYRQAGLSLSEKQLLEGFLSLGISAVLNPQYFFPRIRRQVLSLTTRQLVKKASNSIN